MSTSKQQKIQEKQDKKKFWIRVICIVLVVLLAGSTVLAAALGMF